MDIPYPVDKQNLKDSIAKEEAEAVSEINVVLLNNVFRVYFL